MRLRTEPIHPAVAATLLVASALMCWAAQMPSGARSALVIGYLLLAPGYAVLPSFGSRYLMLHGLLSLCIGIALAVGLSTAMSVAGWWHVDLAVAATWLLVVVSVSWRVWRNRGAVIRLTGRAS